MTSREAELWHASGADELTGYPDGPPLPVAGSPATTVRDALDTIARLHPHADLPGVDLLSARARIAGFRRNAPWSCGGAFRMLPTLDGWFGLSLARDSDLELVPALTSSVVELVETTWDAVGKWLRTVTCAAAEERVALLGLPGAPVPNPPPGPRRDPVVITPGAPRTRTGRPVVLDLTSLWAGPLCGDLLARTGARVIKAESIARPDGTRRGPAEFFDLMNGRKEHRTFDPATGELREMVEQADVILEASRPRALQQLGIDAESLVAQGKVWLSITAYGRSDPMRVGFGDDVAAGAGLVGWRDGEPYPVGDAIADPLAGTVAAAAVVKTLQQDRGALLDLSMHDLAAAAAATARSG